MVNESKDVVHVDKKLQKIAVDVLDMIAGGADEQSVCEHFKVKRGTFVQWIVKYPQFDNAVKEARRQRADSFRSIIHERMYTDEVDDIGMSTGKKVIRTLYKDEVPGEKLIFEKLKWLAEMDNPEKYGAKVKHEGGNVMPVQIVVDTGIRKTPDVVETTTVKNQDVIDLL